MSIKSKKRNPVKTLIVKTIAEKHKISTRAVYGIINGDYSNEEVFSDYMTMWEGINELTLLHSVKQLVPYN